MADELTRADSLREYLTGAASDGGAQADPLLCFGGFRSSTEAKTYDVTVTPAIAGLSVDFAAGGNAEGAGTLTVVDANNIKWKPNGAGTFGANAAFSGTAVKGIVESSLNPGQYLRVTVTTPLIVGSSVVDLVKKRGNIYGLGNISYTDAVSGTEIYFACMVKNVSSQPVTLFKRWIDTLGTPCSSNGAWLGGSGGGPVTTTASFADWPVNGWAQVRNASGVLKEVVYYSTRTEQTLTVTLRGLLGTSATAGSNTDLLSPVPGIAIAKDPDGAQAAGTGIQTIADKNTEPAGVTWSLGITEAGGLSIGTLAAGEEIGIWFWKSIPPTSEATPSATVGVVDAFTAS
jgi:hypothetical protein